MSVAEQNFARFPDPQEVERRAEERLEAYQPLSAETFETADRMLRLLPAFEECWRLLRALQEIMPPERLDELASHSCIHPDDLADGIGGVVEYGHALGRGVECAHGSVVTPPVPHFSAFYSRVREELNRLLFSVESYGTGPGGAPEEPSDTPSGDGEPDE